MARQAGAALDPEQLQTPDEIIAEVQHAANQVGAGAWRVDVYKVLGSPIDGMKEPLIFSCGVEEIDNVRSRCMQKGSGRYRVRVVHNGRIAKQYDVEVLTDPAPAAAAAQPASSDLAQILKMMMDQQEKMRTEMLDALRARPADRNQFEDIKNLALVMKELRDANPPPPANVGVEMFTKGMEFAEKALTLRGGAESEAASTGLMDIARDLINSDAAKELAGAVAQFLKRQPAPRPRPMAQRPLPAIARGPAANPRGIAVPANGGDGITSEMRLGMQYILGEADKGADPALTADYVYSVLPDAALEEMGKQRDLVGYIITKFPEAGKHRAWLSAFVAKLVEFDQENAGNAGNADPNAGPNGQVPAAGRAGGDARSVEGDAGHHANGEGESRQ